jgi:hypothetical protein
MEVLDPGHEYNLSSLDGGEPVHLTFVKREGPKYPGNVGSHPGTTMQECLRALIERGKYVNGQVPCAETEAAIALMRSVLLLLEVRAARRHGHHLDRSFLGGIEQVRGCKKCGHIGCLGRCSE